MKLYTRLALFSAAGGLGVGVCAVGVLLMAREPMTSSLFWKFGGGGVGVGLVLGGVVALGSHFSARERMSGLGAAIQLSLIPLILCALCVVALTQKPSGEDPRWVFIVMGGALVWWLFMLVAGIAQARGGRWGGKLQLLVLVMPILVVCVGVLGSIAKASPEPGSFWNGWNGTRLVGITILVPVCVVGLLLSLLDSGLVVLVAAFAIALMGGAAMGELILRSFGWPIIGAFCGGILSSAVVLFALARPLRKQRTLSAPPPRRC